ncbi:acyl-CoA dehydrogenase family protein, partial [Pseudonocardia sp. ICBG162]|uniref:acyl-CoA dehydrogenase family protein n=1 Tax=Pseudonocardia sp. ICBG162 TaxID=2846761 RepID=UPI001CF6D312
MKRTLYESDHEDFREAFRAFVEKEIVPHEAQWERDGAVARELFTTAGANGFLGIDAPEEFGGGGVKDFRFNAVISEELLRVGAAGSGLGLTLHNDIVLPYLLTYCTEEQKQRWLPGVVSGETILAIAMTEPGIGSDLRRCRRPRSATATTTSSTARRLHHQRDQRRP